jgi:SAM-dependent methyltransferase
VQAVSVFEAYSQYYDLLYRDKDYAGEADYIRNLIERERPGSQTLLDLGCGTGRHDFLLSERGFAVTGVDLSPDMLKIANAERSKRLAAAPTSPSPPPQFTLGDLRSVRLGQRFDVVVSLFHVMSYQSSNEDLLAALRTLREHAQPGGLVLFDAWYGPAVLSSRPSVRVKRLKSDGCDVTRLAEPVLYPNENLVDVNYQIIIRDRTTQLTEEVHETHRMRYLFVPEVKQMLEGVGLRLDRSCEFATDAELSFGTWSALFIATCV